VIVDTYTNPSDFDFLLASPEMSGAFFITVIGFHHHMDLFGAQSVGPMVVWHTMHRTVRPTWSTGLPQLAPLVHRAVQIDGPS